MVQEILKDQGFVVFGVFGSVEEGGGAFGYGLFEKSELGAVEF